VCACEGAACRQWRARWRGHQALVPQTPGAGEHDAVHSAAPPPKKILLPAALRTAAGAAHLKKFFSLMTISYEVMTTSNALGVIDAF
jgi:hypothetical protein